MYNYIIYMVAQWQEWCPNGFEVVAAKCLMHGFQLLSFSFQKWTGTIPTASQSS